MVPPCFGDLVLCDYIKIVVNDLTLRVGLIYAVSFTVRMGRVRIVGTSHIAPESLQKVEEVIRRLQPGIVAVELDRKRFAALRSGVRERPRIRDARRVGVKGWLFAVVGAWVEQKLGAKVGVSPGAEMLRAVDLAREVGARVALIDQDIEVTLRRFSKALTWREKGRFLVDVVKGGLFGKGMQIDLAKVPPKKLIEELLGEVQSRYPSVYRVLVEERNVVMARHLAALASHFPDDDIVAVVGAGHEREIARMLKKLLNADAEKMRKEE